MIEIAGALAAFKAVKELGMVVYDAQVDSSVRDKVRNVLEKMDDAQATLYELRNELLNVQTENLTLKRQIAAQDEWKAKLAKYSMVNTAGGAVVYKFIGEPEHYACPNCMNAERVTPLQDNRTNSGKYRCTYPSCNGAEFPIEEHKRPPPLKYPRGGGEGGWMSS